MPLEVAGEALSKVTGPVRIICNSDLDPQDLITAEAAQAALRRSWCGGKPEDAPPTALPRYRALYDALTNKRIEIRVLPDSAFGLIHGKAGVLRYADGTATSFMGSVNESLSAWKLNYELLWEDNDPATIAWVQEEFDALWNDRRAMDLSVCPFIAQDVQRIAAAIYEAGGVVAAVCHGPAALVNVKLPSGQYLVAGRQVAAFSDAEEEAAGLTKVMPFLLQSTLEQRGARYSKAALWKAHVQVDGRLVTGQNPASAAGVGAAVATLLTGG